MIDSVLNFLRDKLTAGIREESGSEGFEIKLTQLVDETGRYAFCEEVVALTVINFEEERTLRTSLSLTRPTVAKPGNYRNERHFNLHLMAVARFKDYSDSWKAISLVSGFFSLHPVFTHNDGNGLNTSIAKVQVDFENLSYEQIYHVWESIGGRYLPSVVFSVRISTNEQEPAADVM